MRSRIYLGMLAQVVFQAATESLGPSWGLFTEAVFGGRTDGRESGGCARRFPASGWLIGPSGRCMDCCEIAGGSPLAAAKPPSPAGGQPAGLHLCNTRRHWPDALWGWVRTLKSGREER